jgi:fumarate reductase subunit C
LPAAESGVKRQYMEIVELVISVLWFVIVLVVGVPCLAKGIYFTFRAVSNSNPEVMTKNRYTRFNVFNALLVPNALNKDGVQYRAKAGKNLLIFIVLVFITFVGGLFYGQI